MNEPQELTFDVADDVLAAVHRGRLKRDSVQSLVVAHEIGPALELAFALGEEFSKGLHNLPWSTGPSLAPFAQAITTNRLFWAPRARNWVGFYRTLHTPEKREEKFHIYFRARAQQAAEASGFPKRTAQAFAGAMGEIEGNIYEHSGLHTSGIVAFQGGPGVFTFVVGDGGRGVLSSLRHSPQFKALDDHGAALRLALTDGVSRLSDTDPARGMGFHDLFVGLSSLRGRLRFATGDHALVIDGQSPSLAAHRLVQKASGRGFVVSVTCRV